MEKNSITYYRISPFKRAGGIALRFVSVLLTVLFVVVMALFAAMWVLAKGPSPTAQRLFVMSVKETSAVGWLANMYLSETEIEKILGASAPEDESYITDVSLISLPAARPVQPTSVIAGDIPGDFTPDAAAAMETDGDDSGIGLFEVSGAGYRGYMLVVDDPMRVFVGTPDNFGGSGVRLLDMVKKSNAVAGINAGGFYDPDGTSTGGDPDGLVICDGTLKWGADRGYVNVIGFDADGILHVGTMTPTAAMNLGLQWAVSFGPTLISNGIAQDKDALRSGINPRTAIGQRADGAVLLLVVDGRQIHSLGATYEDLVEIFLDFGAVNAANLDGGSSTLMVLDGEFVNSCASVAGPRTIPTAFLVR